MAYGKLFIVSTPIGNLSDITFRAVETLRSASIIACEDTRNTKILCEKYKIETPLESYHKFSESKKCDVFINRLKGGEDVALVSDAGTPLISDPGVKLVQEARLEGIEIVPVVGASAVMALLASIPRQDEAFKFIGFLPRQKGQIENLLNSCLPKLLRFVSGTEPFSQSAPECSLCFLFQTALSVGDAIFLSASENKSLLHRFNLLMFFSYG